MHHDEDNDESDNILAYTVPGLVRAAGIGRSKIYEEIKSGRLKATHIGRRTVITRQNARRWLNAYEEAE